MNTETLRMIRLLTNLMLFLIICTAMFFVLVPVHEGLHWVQDVVDQDFEPLDMEWYTQTCYNSSALGLCWYSYPIDMPQAEVDRRCLRQEFVCYTTCLVLQELIAVGLIVIINKYIFKEIK